MANTTRRTDFWQTATFEVDKCFLGEFDKVLVFLLSQTAPVHLLIVFFDAKVQRFMFLRSKCNGSF